ncbi:phenylalanine--tRNA ligase subunit beta [Acetohalobium arabaticum]|uniref:Phenylalanine--tRNA ligase beta subunit n=1 Tax=Acetohalobium arabaticum (strain ATCC 49924 / DSM 5501 / Z-7288) TaxID=574087 RepID=D9QUN6_ACEAZ|nr:phenylalanine--tRNA ligase subunit beta [Acetohalobium arabaticum]ADL11945.1 phenylalanyl-tRNA synthetase, beta subunit [Acetohalobium arabaticum DSM 5501]
MKVSYNWLQDYIDFDYTPEELASKLTMAGLEVDGIEYQAEGLEDIIIGEILEVNDHENADKLSLCLVDLGDIKEEIVCGAPNVEVGAKSPVAPVGTKLPTGMEIKEAEIRGVKSRGMLCSSDELGLQEERADGIMILDSGLEVGSNFTEALGLDDVIFELDLTPNYADCLSMIGVAREVAVMTGNELQLPEAEIAEKGPEVTELTSIQVEDEELCPRYTARVIKDVEVKESPLWLQQRLKAVGIRPINNIVDITNYVLMEFGQPLHAFDYDVLTENRIVVRRAEDGEKMVTLDEEERELDDDMLVIADAKEPVCIAGVMGGSDSEVTEETTDVLLEAANFSPASIRQTAKKLGLHSESSHRFERGVDINGTDLASRRAVELILDLAGGEVAQGAIDKYPDPVKPLELELKVERVNNLLGTELTKEQIIEILVKLEFEVIDQGSKLKVKVPTFRGDVSRGADLIEEIARIYGYNEVEATISSGSILQGKRTQQQSIKKKTLDTLTGLGLYEVSTFSFTSQQVFDRINLPADSKLRETVKLANPLSSEHEILRTTLIPNLLEVLAENINQNIEEVEIFELGRVFTPQEEKELPKERELLSGALMQKEEEDIWNLDAANFFTLKGKLEEYFAALNITDYEFISSQAATFHPGRTAEIRIGEKKAGIIGELHPDIVEEYELVPRTVLFELKFEVIVEAASDEVVYTELPKYPASTRDIALVVDQKVTANEIEEIIRKVAGELLEKIELFDLYQGEQLKAGTKSLAYSLTYRAVDRTLTDNEVNKLQSEIESELNQEVGAEIRQ